ncbi:MAG: helix-turn-helix domain-containing protein [Egibacteraceae bacterium]
MYVLSTLAPVLIETAPGLALRNARLERGLTLVQAANALCVPVSELSLLEDERLDSLGHVQRYAEFLGLDPGPLLQGSQPNAGPEPVSPSASGPPFSGPRARRYRRPRFGPARPTTLLVALVAIVLSLVLVPAASDLVFGLVSRVTGEEFPPLGSVASISPRPEPLPDPERVIAGSHPGRQRSVQPQDSSAYEGILQPQSATPVHACRFPPDAEERCEPRQSVGAHLPLER